MEQHISYIFILYRGPLYKGDAISYATGTNLQQKLFLMTKNVYHENLH